MPKKVDNSDSEPAVQAAKITSSRALIGVIVAACIAAIASISVAVINSCRSNPLPSPTPVSSPEGKNFTGRVVNKITEDRVRGAKVSLEGEGVPSVVYTDSEGIFSFPLSDPSKELRIRVEATGYEGYDIRITPAENLGTQEIRLEPSRIVSIPSAPSLTVSPPSKASPSVRSEGDVSKYIARCRSLYYQQKYKAAVVQCDQALKIQPSNQEAVTLRTQIKKTIEILNERER